MAKTTSDKTLDQVLLDIEKQFGKGAIMKLGENEHLNQVVKLHLHYMQLQKVKKKVEELLLLMQNMH